MFLTFLQGRMGGLRTLCSSTSLLFRGMLGSRGVSDQIFHGHPEDSMICQYVFFFSAVGSKGKEIFRPLIGENGGEGDYMVKASSFFLDQGLISEETSRKILKKN